MHDLTVAQLSRAMPKQSQKLVTEELVDHINKMVTEPHMREVYRDNLLSYTSVMTMGRFKISSYLDAVRYVSFKLLGDTNIMAYTKAFPDKYQGFIDRNVESKDIASYVTAYNKTKLVNLIYEQSLVPSHVLNADLYQKALNTQADLMMNARSEKVRSDAANSVMMQLKRPETQKLEIEMGVKEDSALVALKQQTQQLVAQQRQIIESGAANAQEIAHSRITVIEAEVVDSGD